MFITLQANQVGEFIDKYPTFLELSVNVGV